MHRVVFHIPARLPLPKIKQTEMGILKVTGGYTLSGTTIGTWRDPATKVLIHDEFRIYITITDDLETLLHTLQQIAKSTQQETIYSEIDGVPTFIHQDTIQPSPEVEFLRTKVEHLKEKVIQVEPIWRGRGFSIDQKLCFVLMPFRDPFNIIFQDHLKPTVEQLGLRCIKADDIYAPKGIMENIWEQICRARVVIAELTGRNPNVFYETGIAHTLGKDVILVAQSMDDLPSDLRHIYCIIYEYIPRGCKQLEEALKTALSTIILPVP